MGIGTSLGAYYDTPFNHQAGIENGVMKPPDTGDDNVQPPDDKPAPKTEAPQPVAAAGPIPDEGIRVNPWITIKPEDIDTGINVGMSAGAGTMENAGPYKNYIDMFLKQPQELNTGELKPWSPETSPSYKKMMENKKESPDVLEQQPWLNTQSAAQYDYSTTQLHPDNFKDINQNALSVKQAKDLHETYSDFKEGSLTKTEYLDEMREYEKFTAMKEQNTLPQGAQVIHKLLDDYPELLKSFEEPSLSPKEKFMNALEEISGKLSSTVANIRDKYTNTVKDAQLNPQVPVAPEAAAKGYTEPAYRGVKLYPDKELNPVYNYEKGGSLYSTASPQLADMYADYLSKHPGYKVPEGTFKEGSQVMPLYVNPKDYHYYDAQGAHWTNANNKAINEARKKGAPGVIVDNVRDEPSSTTSLSPKKIYITFPEGAGTVKSRFAERFDASSPNMMHGVGAVGIGGTVGGYVSTDKASDDPVDQLSKEYYNIPAKDRQALLKELSKEK